MSVLAEAVEVETAERERPAREAAAVVAAARVADERVTERELLTACGRAVAVACRSLSHDEREDLTAHLAETIARKAGALTAAAHVRGDERTPHDWTPPRRLIAHSYLTRRAAHLWARERERLIAGRADARPSMLDQSRQAGALSLNPGGTLESEDPDTDTGASSRSILAAAADLAGHPAPAPENVDVARTCEALGVSATAADAVRAALSGWGSALDLARALNVSHASARKRLQRGRDAVRARYPDPAALLAALGDALADAPDPERVAERVRLSAAERAAEDAVTAVKRSPAHGSGVRSDPAVTLRATRRNWRGYLRGVTGPARPAVTYCGRTWRAPREQGATWQAPVTREALIAGGWITPA
ncbi:MAG: hypothetical protein QOF36_2607 [Microbacteriaceae bacterium]|jgi:hypothetical protein|nr:hypothetical protein [Microbacteriaceae bacterium]